MKFFYVFNNRKRNEINHQKTKEKKGQLSISK